jgi:microcystin-dependent protein
VAEVLTFADLNAEFNNILTNLTPAGVDDASTNAAAMQTTADPYPGGVASLPTSLEGELQRIRYLLAQITGEANWYVDPDVTLAAVAAAAAGYLTPTTGVAKALFDANTILAADTDDTPAALTVAEQRIVGRKTGGNITALTAAEVLGIIGDTVPIGTIITWPTGTPPSGYLECDGSSLDRTTYSGLFAILGVVYGNVDGTHFNLPDYRGRFHRGWAHGQTTDPDKATRTDRGDARDGDYVGTKQADELKSHLHNTASGVSAGGSTRNTAGADNSGNDKNTDSTGGNETRPININVMYCIKY